MLFRKKNKLNLFTHKSVADTDKKIAEILRFPVVSENSDILEKLSTQELELSGIKADSLLGVFQNENEALAKFTCLTYSLESKLNSGKKENYEVVKTHGLSQGFTITYAIYFYFLSKKSELEFLEFLKKRQIPQVEKFHKRLKNYFSKYQGVMLSNSSITYASGYDKENVNSNDIKKALHDLLEMDEEHGAFWISVFNEEDEEFVLQVNQLKGLILVVGENPAIKRTCSSWSEIEELLNLLINEEFERILSVFKENEA